jgi:hypothetical protein
MRRVLLAFLLAIAPFAFAAANDVSGKWSGSMAIKMPDGSVNSTPVTAEFKQSDSKVTGTAGVAGQDQYTVQKGTLDGNQLSFEVQAPDGLYAVKATVVSDTQLKGEIAYTASGGVKGAATLSLTRN